MSQIYAIDISIIFFWIKHFGGKSAILFENRFGQQRSRRYRWHHHVYTNMNPTQKWLHPQNRYSSIGLLRCGIFHCWSWNCRQRMKKKTALRQWTIFLSLKNRHSLEVVAIDPDIGSVKSQNYSIFWIIKWSSMNGSDYSSEHKIKEFHNSDFLTYCRLWVLCTHN